MSGHTNSEINAVSSAIETRDPQAAAQLLPLVYEELRRLAARRMSRESPDHTLQATALVHEAYMRLTRSGQTRWESRAHFFAAAAESMRRILIDESRRKGRLKRGGDRCKLDLRNLDLAAEASTEELQALDEALGRLRTADPVKADLVSLRFFAGLTLEPACCTNEAISPSEPSLRIG